MADVIECRAINAFQVHVKMSNNTGSTLSGQLIGWGPKGVVLKNGSSYDVREGNGHVVAHFSASEWPRHEWDYHSDYCCR